MKHIFKSFLEAFKSPSLLGVTLCLLGQAILGSTWGVPDHYVQALAPGILFGFLLEFCVNFGFLLPYILPHIHTSTKILRNRDGKEILTP